ncbi:MAG: hypothetical protein HY360_20550 [Verrucomicrobia bacterium]|nr:hypothetical protein [Verrucomicrobiota bacterium]
MTVRATLRGHPNLFVEGEIIVHAVPVGFSETAILLLVPPDPINAYNGSFKHRFSSSGGSLEDVRITERVTLEQDPFDDEQYLPWAYPIDYGDTPFWTLDNAGWMDASDYLHDPWNTRGRQLPYVLCRGPFVAPGFHDPNPLPAIMVTRQTFAWECPFGECQRFHPFATHDIASGFINGELDKCDRLENPLYIFVNRGKIRAQLYVGDPYPVLGDVQFADQQLPADGISSTVAFLDEICWIPSPFNPDQLPAIVWSFVDEVPPGTQHQPTDNPFVERIIAGTLKGKATISAINTNCNHSEGTIHLKKP